MARFNAPTGLALDTAGNVYVADNDNHSIRMRAFTFAKAPGITGAGLSPDGGFQATITGAPDQVYTIQNSTNLATWSPVTTGTPPANGAISFSDPSAAHSGHLFYRARSP